MNLYLFSNQLFIFICLTSCICYAWEAQYNFLIYNPKILIKISYNVKKLRDFREII